MDTFPAFDHTLSPRTGWTRAHWVALLARMTDGYARAAERSGSAARALYPDDRRGLPDATDAIESFARIASAWGPWLRQPASTEDSDGKEMREHRGEDCAEEPDGDAVPPPRIAELGELDEEFHEIRRAV